MYLAVNWSPFLFRYCYYSCVGKRSFLVSSCRDVKSSHNSVPRNAQARLPAAESVKWACAPFRDLSGEERRGDPIEGRKSILWVRTPSGNRSRETQNRAHRSARNCPSPLTSNATRGQIFERIFLACPGSVLPRTVQVFNFRPHSTWDERTKLGEGGGRERSVFRSPVSSPRFPRSWGQDSGSPGNYRITVVGIRAIDLVASWKLSYASWASCTFYCCTLLELFSRLCSANKIIHQRFRVIIERKRSKECPAPCANDMLGIFWTTPWYETMPLRVHGLVAVSCSQGPSRAFLPSAQTPARDLTETLGPKLKERWRPFWMTCGMTCFIRHFERTFCQVRGSALYDYKVFFRGRNW